MRTFSAFALLAALTATAPAGATVISMAFTGVVTTATPATTYPFNATVGTPVYGTITLQSTSFPCSVATTVANCTDSSPVFPTSNDVLVSIQFGSGPLLSLAPQNDGFNDRPYLILSDAFSTHLGSQDAVSLNMNSLLNGQIVTFGLNVAASQAFVPSLNSNLAVVLPVNFVGSSAGSILVQTGSGGPELSFTITNLGPPGGGGGSGGGGVPPFGSFDTPISGTANLSGAISVTGWALDRVGVTKVDIYRTPVANETPGNFGYVYVGTATFVAGARPDVQALYPGYPNASSAGWGYQLLTNLLPGGGNGTYGLHAFAYDVEGLVTELSPPGKVIAINNNAATLPFGTIDTPSPGGTASGTQFVNFGWALTPDPPTLIPLSGTTINVMVDGQTLGHPVYNQYRADIATLFPNYVNSYGAVGYYLLDTTKFANGVHTIDWIVTDSAGRSQGIGSRVFTIANAQPAVVHAAPAVLGATSEQDTPEQTMEVQESGHLELTAGVRSGYAVVNGEAQELPPGTSFNGGTFYWLLAPGFLGDYHLVLVRPDGGQIPVQVRVRPKRFQ